MGSIWPDGRKGVRSQESGVRSQESGVRSQESGVRSQESGARSPGVRSPGVRSCRMGSPLTGSVNGDAGFDLASGRFDASTSSAKAFAPLNS